jgi:hypothetical protein
MLPGQSSRPEAAAMAAAKGQGRRDFERGDSAGFRRPGGRERGPTHPARPGRERRPIAADPPPPRGARRGVRGAARRAAHCHLRARCGWQRRRRQQQQQQAGHVALSWERVTGHAEGTCVSCHPGLWELGAGVVSRQHPQELEPQAGSSRSRHATGQPLRRRRAATPPRAHCRRAAGPGCDPAAAAWTRGRAARRRGSPPDGPRHPTREGERAGWGRPGPHGTGLAVS